MKVFAILAAATVATVQAADCPLIALAGVASGADSLQCGKDADGYSVVTAQYPSATQLPKMCASTACNKLLAQLKTAAPEECSLTLVQPPVDLYKTLLNPIETYCNKWKAENQGTTAAPATTKPATTTAAPTATTAAPTATTAAPTATTAAPAVTTKAPVKETKSASGSGAGEEIETPNTAAPTTTAASNASNATTSTPAPTKSSASAIATAAGAVVFAVAASMF